jgi:hypothetical protein
VNASRGCRASSVGKFDFGIEKLEQAREAGWFSFKVFEYRGKH